MSKTKKIVMVLMIVFVSCLLIAMNFEVKATSDDNPIIDISGNLDLTLDSNELTTEPDLNITDENNDLIDGPIIQPDTNIEENVTNTLPKTGVTEDITVMFFIIICAISAIYAYRKIKNYNV